MSTRQRRGRGRNWTAEYETGLMSLFSEMWRELGYDDTSVHNRQDRERKYAAGWKEFQQRYVASFPEEADRDLRAIQDKVHSLYKEALKADAATNTRHEGSERGMRLYSMIAEAIHAHHNAGQPVNRELERVLMQPPRAGSASQFLDEDMQNANILRHGGEILARNLRQRNFSALHRPASVPGNSGVRFTQPLPDMSSEPLDSVPTPETQGENASTVADSQVPTEGDVVDDTYQPDEENHLGGTHTESDQAESENDAEPEPRPAQEQFVSESVARKKKRVTDATCLREMVDIQSAYLVRDIRMENKIDAFLAEATSLLQVVSTYYKKKTEYLERREEERREEEPASKRKDAEMTGNEERAQNNASTPTVQPLPSPSTSNGVDV